MRKIVTVLGARPQFIKAATLSRILRDHYSKDFLEKIIHTGQHYDKNMSEIFFEEMKIPRPDYNLSTGGKSHGQMTGEMLIEIEKIISMERPDIVLIYGDTNSTLAGALVASKMNIPVAHVEAGLRSFNMKMPEEINRILSDRVSTFLFCPSPTAVENLKTEGIFNSTKQRVVQVGDIMYDAFIFYKKFGKISPNLLNITDKKFFLATIHRQETTDNPEILRSLFSTLEKIAIDKMVILPLHPRTKKLLNELEFFPKNITIIDPVGYLDMISLIEKSDLVLTDSGGLQKEAYFSGKPCIILREETEWVELLENNYARLTGTNEDQIFRALEFFKSPISFNPGLFGNGNSAEKILETIKNL
jgi:UDP-GlcNAc3NAcA epimerase